MNKYLRERSEEEICAGCKFLPTKPEAIGEEIAEFVNTALELAELERGGTRFNYPDALSQVEWVCLRGLTRGRDRADSLQKERDRAEQRLKEKKDRLNNNG